MQRARRGDARIELAQRSGREIARIGVRREACLDLLLVERREIRMAHIDFATHIDHARIGVALQPRRHIFHGPDIGGDILALKSIAARDAIDQFAIFITQ